MKFLIKKGYQYYHWTKSGCITVVAKKTYWVEARFSSGSIWWSHMDKQLNLSDVELIDIMRIIRRDPDNPECRRLLREVAQNHPHIFTGS